MFSEEELTASEAVAFLQSAADARRHIEKEDMPVEVKTLKCSVMLQQCRLAWAVISLAPHMLKVSTVQCCHI